MLAGDAMAGCRRLMTISLCGEEAGSETIRAAYPLSYCTSRVLLLLLENIFPKSVILGAAPTRTLADPV
jgi:hypothetical protein